MHFVQTLYQSCFRDCNCTDSARCTIFHNYICSHKQLNSGMFYQSSYDRLQKGAKSSNYFNVLTRLLVCLSLKDDISNFLLYPISSIWPLKIFSFSQASMAMDLYGYSPQIVVGEVGSGVRAWFCGRHARILTHQEPSALVKYICMKSVATAKTLTTFHVALFSDINI